MEGTPPKKKENDAFSTDETGVRIDHLRDRMYSRQHSNIPPRERHHLKEPVGEAQRDWETPKGDEQKAVGKLPRSYSLATVFLVFAGLFFVISAGFAATFFFSGSESITPRKIDINIYGPQSLQSSEVLELQVEVVNRNNAALELADMIVKYPEGARAPFDLQTDVSDQRIPLGEIGPGEKRTGTVNAVILAPEGTQQEISISLEYRLRDSNAIFFAEEKYSVLISGAALSLSVDTNEEVTSGQTIDTEITVISGADTELKDVVLSVEYPFGFAFEGASPRSEARNSFWELGNLQPGEERTISIRGVMAGERGDERVFRYTAGIRKNTTIKEVEIPLVETERTVALTNPFLGLSLTYGRGISGGDVARPGKTVGVEVNWKNNLTTPITDAVIALTLEGVAVDETSIRVADGFYRSLDNVIIWDKNTTGGEFTSIAPGASGKLSFEFTPREIADITGVRDPSIQLTLHAAGKRLSETRVPETLESTAQSSIKIATNAVLGAEALYTHNPFGSTGPLPPRVDFETTYAVVWEVSNSSSALTDVRVVGVLPPYVRWKDVVSPTVENVTYNKLDSTVTWLVGDVAAGVGVGEVPARKIAFSIGFIPSTTQIKKTPNIIEGQILSGIDVFTQERVQTGTSDLNILLQETGFDSKNSVVAE